MGSVWEYQMPTDYSLEVRKSIVVHLKAFGPLVALVAAASIHGEEAPADPDWPFIRYGLSDDAAFEALGWDGSEHAVTIHAFSNGPYTDAVKRITKQVIEAMKTWQAPTGTGIVAAEWEGTTMLRDSGPNEASKYHAVIRFAVAVAA